MYVCMYVFTHMNASKACVEREAPRQKRLGAPASLLQKRLGEEAPSEGRREPRRSPGKKKL